jgi:lysophospholipase L1-like esterase
MKASFFPAGIQAKRTPIGALARKAALAFVLLLLLVLANAGCTYYHSRVNPNIAFMGDSITNYWSLPVTNLGVPGNTTTQMLARFPAEVLGNNYKAMVLLGGTNDVRVVHQPIGPVVDTAISNISEMASQAEANNLEVVLCLIPPIQIETDTVRVEALNTAIQALAAEHNYKLRDYYTPMVGHPEYFKDTLHPNAQGYAVMQKALAVVIPLDY